MGRPRGASKTQWCWMFSPGRGAGAGSVVAWRGFARALSSRTRSRCGHCGRTWRRAKRRTGRRSWPLTFCQSGGAGASAGGSGLSRSAIRTDLVSRADCAVRRWWMDRAGRVDPGRDWSRGGRSLEPGGAGRAPARGSESDCFSRGSVSVRTLSTPKLERRSDADLEPGALSNIVARNYFPAAAFCLIVPCSGAGGLAPKAIDLLEYRSRLTFGLWAEITRRRLPGRDIAAVCQQLFLPIWPATAF